MRRHERHTDCMLYVENVSVMDMDCADNYSIMWETNINYNHFFPLFVQSD